MPQLIAHPRQTVSFDEFCDTPGPAVALDGYVEGPPQWSRCGRHASFDHHGAVDRFSTRATCEQVALAIRSRFAVVVDRDGSSRHDLAVHVNDPDPDVALSWWLLSRPSLAEHPAARTLVDVEGAVDTTGGMAFPADPAVLETLAWVSDPWASVRNEVASFDADDMVEVIFEIAARVDAVVDGRPERLTLTSSYETLSEAAGVWGICEHHPLGRARAVLDGAEVIVSVRPGPVPSRASVSVAKASPWIGVDLSEVWAALNDADDVADGDRDRWGGSDLVGGSPREAGTSLGVDDICEIVSTYYR